MKYTVLLSHQPGQHDLWRATVPGLPDCVTEAPTRNEALMRIQHCIAEIVNHTEMIHVDVDASLKTNGDQTSAPWKWFGAFSEDSMWGGLFDDIEQQRDREQVG